MSLQDLKKLFETNWFGAYQDGLRTRFLANQMVYDYNYKYENTVKLLQVVLRKEKSHAMVLFYESGVLKFDYYIDGKQNCERFKNCSQEDFNLMLAHAFLVLKDKNFEFHKEWYSKLELN